MCMWNGTCNIYFKCKIYLEYVTCHRAFLFFKAIFLQKMTDIWIKGRRCVKSGWPLSLVFLSPPSVHLSSFGFHSCLFLLLSSSILATPQYLRLLLLIKWTLTWWLSSGLGSLLSFHLFPKHFHISPWFQLALTSQFLNMWHLVPHTLSGTREGEC